MNSSVHTHAVSRPPSSYADVVKQGRTIPLFSPQVLRLPNVDFYYNDLLCKRQITNLVSNLKKKTKGFHFITADGGFDEQEQYDAKEILHYNLILAEVVCILLLQDIGGTCVLKIFETFTATTISILYVLASCYESFDIVKPSTSRPTNAERYIVCKNFLGTSLRIYDVENLITTQSLYQKVLSIDGKIPDEKFTNRVLSRAKTFGEQQIKAIEDVIAFVDSKKQNSYINKKPFSDQKKTTFEEWKKEFGLDENIL